MSYGEEMIGLSVVQVQRYRNAFRKIPIVDCFYVRDKQEAQKTKSAIIVFTL
jgi:hypothetical protein